MTTPTEPTQEPTKLVCKTCGKIIIGLTRSQAEYNLKSHRITHELKKVD